MQMAMEREGEREREIIEGQECEPQCSEQHAQIVQCQLPCIPCQPLRAQIPICPPAAWKDCKARPELNGKYATRCSLVRGMWSKCLLLRVDILGQAVGAIKPYSLSQ